jgi:Ca2+-binding RTX toxin-like protein
MVTKTQNTDSIQSSTDGFDFDASNETGIIDPGVVIFSQSAFGVSNHANANTKLVNEGRVYAAGFLAAGVYLNVGNGSVSNAPGAEIFGSGFGIAMGGSGTNVVNNFGDIVSVSHGISIGIDFGSTTHWDRLNNHGYIFGTAAGVTIDSTFTGGTFNNFSTIKSIQDGIEIATAPNLLTKINNATGGIIEGTSASIKVFAGILHLINHGTIIGNIVDTGGGRDVIVNTGKIKGMVELGSGNCHFNGTGGTSGTIIADGGNDRITAGKGNVLIELGGGQSTLTGGPGHDRFLFDSALVGQVDKIMNFGHGLDKIVLLATDFAGIGAASGTLAAADFHVGAHASSFLQHILYNPANGFLSYDPDGSGPLTPVHFATLSPHLALTHSDFLVAA